jgi:hypothetical protein
MPSLTLSVLKQLVANLPSTKVKENGNITAFYVKAKVFITYNHQHNRSCAKLSASDQALFTKVGKGSVEPVPNKYGKYGWTLLYMQTIDPKLYEAVLTMAYCHNAPQVLAQQVLNSLIDLD